MSFPRRTILAMGLLPLTLFLNLSLNFACTPKNRSYASAVTQWDWLNVNTSDAAPDEAAAIFGIAPDTTSAGECTKCHQEFYDSAKQTELQWKAAQARSCFRRDIRIKEEAVLTLACLGGYRGSNSDAAAIEAAIQGLNPRKLGVLAAGLTTTKIQQLFKTAGYEAFGEKLAKTSAMPLGQTKLTDEQFEVMFRWFAQLLPGREKFKRHLGPQICLSENETFIGSKIKDHVRTMVDGKGWSAINKSIGLNNFACDDGRCFQQQISGTDVFTKIDGVLTTEGELRTLYRLKGEGTRFWVRSSADGRFIAYGSMSKSDSPSADAQAKAGDVNSEKSNSADSRVIDLAPMLAEGKPRMMSMEAKYDPAFAPDNRSFMMQSEEHGTRICDQSLLEKPGVQTITFDDEDECSLTSLQVGLYQSIGSNLANSDMMTLNSNFFGDSGNERNRFESPVFSSQSNVTFGLIRRSEDKVFEKIATTDVRTPYEGNWMLAPSQKLAASTVSGSTLDFKPRHGGYHLVLIPEDVKDLEPLPSGNDESSGRLCIANGEKPTFSLDERYLVYYAYEQHEDEVDNSESSSDIYLIDLLGDGKAQRLTHVPKGSYAQFPHFRSDGWIYFSIWNSITDRQEFVATDAALHLKR
jgi:hypothetical protein